MLRLLLATLLFATPALADAKKEIAAANQKLQEAMAKKDAAAVAALYTEDALLLAPGGEPMSGRAAVQAMYEKLAPHIKSFQAKTEELHVAGGWAWERSSYTADFGPAQEHGKSLTVWKKSGKQWLIHRDMFSANHPPPKAAEAAAAPAAAAPAEGEAKPAETADKPAAQ
jgi:uncharacterized protein (TIGR02246 family)